MDLEEYIDNAVQKIKIGSGETVSNPGVRLSLASDRMGQTTERKYFTFSELIQSPLGSVILAAKDKQASDINIIRDDRSCFNYCCCR